MGAPTETGMDKGTIFKYNRLDQDRIPWPRPYRLLPLGQWLPAGHTVCPWPRFYLFKGSSANTSQVPHCIDRLSGPAHRCRRCAGITNGTRTAPTRTINCSSAATSRLPLKECEWDGSLPSGIGKSTASALINSMLAQVVSK